MDFKPFDESNHVFTAPPSMEDVLDLPAFAGRVEDLPCFIGTDTEEIPVIITQWQMSASELQRCIEADGVIWLTILGNSLPPVYLGTESPFLPQDEGG